MSFEKHGRASDTSKETPLEGLSFIDEQARSKIRLCVDLIDVLFSIRGSTDKYNRACQVMVELKPAIEELDVHLRRGLGVEQMPNRELFGDDWNKEKDQ